MEKLKIAIVTINQPSLDSACKLYNYIKDDYIIDIYGKKELNYDLPKLRIYNKLDDILPNAWETYDVIVCILAMGAVIRKIAPLLKDKSTDPAIIVINLALDKIVPLLSGHIGGANQFATALTKKLPQCINFISTATDQTNTLAFDNLAVSNNWKIDNLKQLANISNRLLNKKEVKVYTTNTIFDTITLKKNLILIEDKNLIDENTVVIDSLLQTNNLALRPKISLGIGCNRDTSYEDIQKAFELFLEKFNLTKDAIKDIASFEAKKDEIGLLEFVKQNNFDIIFYNKDDINKLENEFSSSASTKFFGLKGVAEPSSILNSTYKELIIKKQVYFKSITISGAI